jgi:fructose-1-phosphate kinase PfkB-like protein
MIYTITLNPALDYYLEVDDLVVDDANRVRYDG